MNSRLVDMTGQRFGKLMVIRFACRVHGKSAWHCRCDCGGKTVTRRTDLLNGKAKTCGCSRIERPPNLRHGMCHTPTYRSWLSMWTRCTNHKVESFKRYGGCGIKVCKRWTEFTNFLADMGLRPRGKTLDRIDSSKDYKPSNCRWATLHQQRHNRKK